MNALKLSLVLAISSLLGCCATARATDTTEIEVRFAALEQKLGVPEKVDQVDYLEAMPPLHLPHDATAAPAESEVVVDCGPTCGEDCCCDPACQPSYLKFNAGVGPTQLHLTDSAFGRWPDGAGTSFEFDLGFEDKRGYGLRADFWGFVQDATPPQTDVRVVATTINLDLYKRFWGEDGDLAIGVSMGGAGLTFRLPNSRESNFSGAGLGFFADGFLSFHQFKKSEIGLVGRGRVTMMDGEWEDNTGFVVPDTSHDTMLIVETDWGLEYRRRFGRCEDKYWRAAVVSEFQRWDSEWMGSNLGSAAGFSGLSLELGVAW